MKPITHPQLQSFQKIYLFNRGKKEKKKEEQTFLISSFLTSTLAAVISQHLHRYLLKS